MARKAAPKGPAPKAAHPNNPTPFHGQQSGAPPHKPLAQGKQMPSTNPKPFGGQLPQKSP